MEWWRTGYPVGEIEWSAATGVRVPFLASGEAMDDNHQSSAQTTHCRACGLPGSTAVWEIATPRLLATTPAMDKASCTSHTNRRI